MKEINKLDIEKFEQNYRDNLNFKIGRHALIENSISSITYVNETEQNIQSNFSIDLDNLPVLNQGKSRRCWIYSGLELLRLHLSKKYNINDFVLSANYISFYDKLEKANFFMETMINLINKKIDDREVEFILRHGIRDAGYWQNFVNLVNKYGVVPEYAYPDTYSSFNTSELNQLLSRYLRKFTFEIRKNTDTIETIKKQTLHNIYNMLCNCYGIPPKSFNFEFIDKNNNYHCFQNIQPIEFLNDYVCMNINNYYDIINYPSKDKPFNRTYVVNNLYSVIGLKENIFLNLEYKKLERMIIEQLKNGEIVYFSCDNGKYMNNKMGIWNEKQYDYESLFNIDLSMSKGEMLDSRECYFGHTMVITGIELRENKITKFKIKNSWGKSETNSGYWVATSSWMQDYLYEIIIKKDYLKIEELEMFNKRPIKLDIWDPIAELT